MPTLNLTFLLIYFILLQNAMWNKVTICVTLWVSKRPGSINRRGDIWGGWQTWTSAWAQLFEWDWKGICFFFMCLILFIIWCWTLPCCISYENENYKQFVNKQLCLFQYNLEKETAPVVFIVSTTGDGEPPDNALKFVKNLKKKTLPSDQYQHLTYALLGKWCMYFFTLAIEHKKICY